MMAAFKVALVGYDGQTIPEWVYEGMAKAEIEFVVNECTTHEELARCAGDADVVWVFGGSRSMNGGMTAKDLAILPRCGAIIRTGSGTDNVPVAAATQLGIVVANTPEALTDAVSDHAIGLLFTVIRQIALQDRHVRNGTWDRYRGWPRWHLRGQTLGLVGFGNIPRAVATKMRGFDMRILAYDPYVEPDVFTDHGVRSVQLDELLSQSHFVSLHCPLTKDTRHLVDEPRLRLMKPTSILINTSRGPVVDESALVRALTEGWIGAAGLDVLDPEPPDRSNPLLKLDNVVITPHIAGYSDQYLSESWRLSLETAIALSCGKWPRSYVNRDVKPRWELTE